MKAFNCSVPLAKAVGAATASAAPNRVAASPRRIGRETHENESKRHAKCRKRCCMGVILRDELSRAASRPSGNDA